MLTIKAEVQRDKQRSDGTYNVKVRFTQDRKVKRLSSSLSDFIKEIDKEHIGDIRKYQLFVVDLLHISRPLSIFFTLSRAALSCFALSFAAARALRIEGFFSRFSFFAENS